MQHIFTFSSKCHSQQPGIYFHLLFTLKQRMKKSFTIIDLAATVLKLNIGEDFKVTHKAHIRLLYSMLITNHIDLFFLIACLLVLARITYKKNTSQNYKEKQTDEQKNSSYLPNPNLKIVCVHDNSNTFGKKLLPFPG